MNQYLHNILKILLQILNLFKKKKKYKQTLTCSLLGSQDCHCQFEHELLQETI